MADVGSSVSMKNLKLVVLSLVLVAGLAGCAQQGGNVDQQAVQQQAEKEKEINKKALEATPPPAGEGPGS